MAGEGDLAAIGEPIHHWMQIPEEFQLGPGIVLSARLLQGPLQCCRDVTNVSLYNNNL